MLNGLTLERAKELLVIIPAAHLLLCFTYLFFYYSSFGHGIWLYSSPTDVFAVSFSDVAPGYISLILGLLIGHYIYSPRTNAEAIHVIATDDDVKTFYQQLLADHWGVLNKDEYEEVTMWVDDPVPF